MNKKFSDKYKTKDGYERAFVNFTSLKTLWFNTGTLCNLTCKDCYIESSPKNDDLVYISKNEVIKYLDELELYIDYKPKIIGFTGGEPFMNPEIINILNESLERGYKVLVLTNAMKPIMRHCDSLIKIKQKYSNSKSAIELHEVNNSYSLELKSTLNEFVEDLLPSELRTSELRTLATIAIKKKILQDCSFSS